VFAPHLRCWGGLPVPFVITQPCIDTTDQSCVEVCPVDCIHFESGADRMLYINPTECIDCGACQPACPVTAIYPEADVPAEMQAFTAINAQWYSDPAGARAEVQKIAGGAAPAAAAAAPAADGGSAPAEAAAAAAAPVAAAAAPAARREPPKAIAQQVQARPLPTPASAQLPPHLTPASLIGVVGIALVFFLAVVVAPGPTIVEFAPLHFKLGATVLVAIPVMLPFLVMFLRGEWRAMASFASKGGRRVSTWRRETAEWRRSEEMRRYSLQKAVQRIAEDRYGFPNAAQPRLRTHVNLPSPSMALEFSGEKVWPDILVVTQPSNKPAMVVQVETRETVTREQALYVWSRLENEQAPLDLYVPVGLAARAKDYARAAGIKHIRFRTWRWQPFGMIVREV
jgi:NAD-dependent dihydropyrimidine dehydrogenase PreA subunit